jgi:hypothetical protein
MPLQIEYECAQMNIPVVAFARSDRRIEGTLSACLDERRPGHCRAPSGRAGLPGAGLPGRLPGVSVSVKRHGGFR